VDMLILRPRSKTDGRKRTGRLPVHRVRGRKYGPILHEQTIKASKDIAVYGPHSAGKSRWITKLYDNAAAVWLDQPAALVRGLEPIGQWAEQPAVEAWHDTTRAGKTAADGTTAKPWAKLKAHERLEAFVTWASDQKAVLLIDDAHKLAARKADVACRLVSAAAIVVHAASEETRISQSLRMALARRDPQVIRLKSEAAYDYTSGLTWLLCLVAAAMGAWPVAAAIGGLKMASRGSRAAKQT
jgi:hypothetical protein